MTDHPGPHRIAMRPTLGWISRVHSLERRTFISRRTPLRGRKGFTKGEMHDLSRRKEPSVPHPQRTQFVSAMIKPATRFIVNLDVFIYRSTSPALHQCVLC